MLATGRATVGPRVEARAATTVVPANDTSIALTAVRLDGGSGSVLVSAGVPLQVGQLDPADIGNVSLWLNTGGGLSEVGCYVEVLAERPSSGNFDGSAWSVLVQWTGDPDTITAAEVRLTGTPGEARIAKTTPPAEPAAMLIPTSATHLRDCELFPYPLTLASEWDADFSGLSNLYSDALHHAISQAAWGASGYRGKYAGATMLYQWVFMNGPAVTNCDDFLSAANDVCENSLKDTSGNGQTYNAFDLTGLALHYLLTGSADSWTTMGKWACRLMGEPWSWAGGGREVFHGTEAGLWAYLLDIDDVSRGVYGPYTRAQHMSNIESKVNTWRVGWDAGSDAALSTPVAGIINADGNISYPHDGVLSYMNAMMHCGVMRLFIKLDGVSATLDSYRSGWEADLLNFCDVILNDADGFDDTAGVNVWVYSMFMLTGTTNIEWSDGWTYPDDVNADQSHPGTTAWPFWWSGFVNNVYGYAKDAATGAQAVEFSGAFRTGVETLIARAADPGTSNQWMTYNQGGGAGYYLSGTSVDVVGVSGIMGMGLSQSAPWLGEAA